MTSISGLSEQVIRRHAAGEIFSRGEGYVREGMVTGLMLRDGVLEALVHSSQYDPYRVRVTFDAGGVAAATCTCPYGTGAWCKHIVAALLVALRQPESVQVAPPLEALLEPLNREQLRGLLLRLVARQPDLADMIAGEVGATQARATPQAAPARPPVNVGPIQRQVRALLRSSYRDYDDYDDDGPSSTISEGMGEILDQVRGFVEGGDSANALSLLEAITDATDALVLATVLREGGELDAALRVAEHGLALGGLRGALGDWLASLAPGLGRPDLALHAAEMACASEPSMERYLATRDLAGEDWPELRARLLDQLRGNAGGWMEMRAQAEIFLYEDLIDDAITVAERGGYGVLEPVMDAAIATRPQWVISKAIAQAAPIMNGGKAQHYGQAVNWLRRARDAYRAAGAADAWERYLAEVRATHGRKYKLMGLLKGL